MIGGGPLALTDDEHGEVAAGEEGGGRQCAYRATEHDDVVMLAHHGAAPSARGLMRTSGRPPDGGAGVTSTRPSAIQESDSMSVACSTSRMRAARVSRVSLS